MTFYYLGAPYTSPDPEVRARRQSIASRYAAVIATQGFAVFSPITHGHQIADYLPLAVAHDHDFWMRQCLPILGEASLMLVLPVPGWRQSLGLAKEIAYAHSKELPVAIIYCPEDPDLEPVPIRQAPPDAFLYCLPYTPKP